MALIDTPTTTVNPLNTVDAWELLKDLISPRPVTQLPVED